MRTIILALAVLLGVLGIANGIFMLVAPGDWYLAVPGVTDTGPFNQHFVRDIGLIFLLLGGAFLLGAAQPHMRVVLWTAATACYAVMPCSISGRSPSASAPPTSCRAISRP